jgi:hypothetical protein
MAHFARLDDNNIVTMVTVISNDDMIDENGDEAEALGIAVCEKVIGPGPWVQTSYNGNFRKRYANTGHIYNAEHDAFVEQSPYPSWVLNDQHDWEAPVPKPEGEYSWNEETQTWDAVPTEEPAP